MSVGHEISVILPVFMRQRSERGTALLKRALDSVLEQKFPAPFELIVIDDGSAVSVSHLFKGTPYWANLHIRWVRIPRNCGLVNTLNLGLRIAKYKFIARIDADDCWRPGKIEKQMKHFAQDPDLSIVGTGMALVHENGKSNVDLIRPGNWEGILQFFTEVGCPFPHGSIVGRRSVFNLLGGYSHDPRFSHCEDFALWGLWLRFFKPAIIEEVLYNYTVSDASVSAIHTKQQRHASGIVQRQFLSLGDTSKFPTILGEISEVLGLSMFETGRLCFLLWKYRPRITLPRKVVEYIRMLIPDRRFALCPRGSNIFVLSMGQLLANRDCEQKQSGDTVSVDILDSTAY